MAPTDEGEGDNATGSNADAAAGSASSDVAHDGEQQETTTELTPVDTADVKEDACAADCGAGGANPAEGPQSTTQRVSKRTADRQITKDDFADNENDDDEAAPSGPFQRASEDVLKHRKIVRLPRTEEGSIDMEKIRKKKSDNPFASVHLAASSTDNATAATTSNARVFGATTVFKGFGSTDSATGSGASPFTASPFGGFGTSALASGPPKINFGFGSAKGFGEAAAAGSSSGFGTAGTGGFNFGTTVPQNPTDSNSAQADSPDKGATPPITIATFASTATGVSAVSAPLAMNSTTTVALPDQYELRSGEEDDSVLFSARCKTHRLGFLTQKEEDDAIAAEAASRRTGVASVPPSSENDVTAQKRAAVASEPANDDTKNLDPTAGGDGKSKDEDDIENKATAAAAAAAKWHEVGTGPLKVLRNSKTNHVRLVQRRESTPNGPSTILLVNVSLWKESTTEQPSEKHVKVSTLNSQSCKAETILFKFKLVEEATDFKQTVDKIIATTAKSFMTNKEDGNVKVEVANGDSKVDDSAESTDKNEK